MQPMEELDVQEQSTIVLDESNLFGEGHRESYLYLSCIKQMSIRSDIPVTSCTAASDWSNA